MEAIYKLNANEVDSNLIDAIKDFFKDRQITIKITTEVDETEYLLGNPANRIHLESNMNSQDVTTFAGSEFDKYVKEKLES